MTNYRPISLINNIAKIFEQYPNYKLRSFRKKLDKVGIRGKVYDIFKECLASRPRQVKTDNSYSATKIIETGVSQGTTLGPISLQEKYGYKIISYAKQNKKPPLQLAK